MSERTLAAHMCIKKRRWADKDLTHTRLGYRVFQMFYEMNTTAKVHAKLTPPWASGIQGTAVAPSKYAPCNLPYTADGTRDRSPTQSHRGAM